MRLQGRWGEGSPGDSFQLAIRLLSFVLIINKEREEKRGEAGECLTSINSSRVQECVCQTQPSLNPVCNYSTTSCRILKQSFPFFIPVWWLKITISNFSEESASVLDMEEVRQTRRHKQSGIRVTMSVVRGSGTPLACLLKRMHRWPLAPVLERIPFPIQQALCVQQRSGLGMLQHRETQLKSPLPGSLVCRVCCWPLTREVPAT